MSLPKKRKPLAERIEEAITDLARARKRIVGAENFQPVTKNTKEKTMSATNKKKSNKTELNKLGKTQTRDKKISQKTGKTDKNGMPRKKAVKQTIAPDATVTIKPRTVKIKPAA